MNVLGRLFLNSCKDRRKDGSKDIKSEFFVILKRTYVLNKGDETFEVQNLSYAFNSIILALSYQRRCHIKSITDLK